MIQIRLDRREGTIFLEVDLDYSKENSYEVGMAWVVEKQ
jgi:hypothetical protein